MACTQARAILTTSVTQTHLWMRSPKTNALMDHKVPINNLVPQVPPAELDTDPADVPVVNIAVDDDPVPPFINLAVDPFDACLQGLTLMPGAIQHFHQQGFTTIDQLRHVPFKSMDHMLDAITKRNVIPANTSILYLAMQGLKALRAWILYRDTRGQGIHPDYSSASAMVLWQSRIGRLEHVLLEPPASATKPPFLANINDWQRFEQLFHTYLLQCHSHRCGAPLPTLSTPAAASERQQLPCIRQTQAPHLKE
jgi:hypothetical protein